jgi:hypothetical protein
MPYLESRATPVVPELEGKACETPPRTSSRRPRLDPRTPSSETMSAPPVEVVLLAQASPSLRGKGRKATAVDSCRLSLLPSRLSCPGRLRYVFDTI